MATNSPVDSFWAWNTKPNVPQPNGLAPALINALVPRNPTNLSGQFDCNHFSTVRTGGRVMSAQAVPVCGQVANQAALEFAKVPDFFASN